MALPANRPLSEAALTVSLVDISTSSSAFVVSPWRGTLKRWYSTISAAITTADGSLSLEINGTAVTGSTITIDYASSAAGTVDSATTTGANYVNEGDVIEVLTTGACDTTSIGTFTIVIERD